MFWRLIEKSVKEKNSQFCSMQNKHWCKMIFYCFVQNEFRKQWLILLTEAIIAEMGCWWGCQSDDYTCVGCLVSSDGVTGDHVWGVSIVTWDTIPWYLCMVTSNHGSSLYPPHQHRSRIRIQIINNLFVDTIAAIEYEYHHQICIESKLFLFNFYQLLISWKHDDVKVFPGCTDVHSFVRGSDQDEDYSESFWRNASFYTFQSVLPHIIYQPFI